MKRFVFVILLSVLLFGSCSYYYKVKIKGKWEVVSTKADLGVEEDNLLASLAGGLAEMFADIALKGAIFDFKDNIVTITQKFLLGETKVTYQWEIKYPMLYLISNTDTNYYKILQIKADVMTLKLLSSPTDSIGINITLVKIIEQE